MKVLHICAYYLYSNMFPLMVEALEKSGVFCNVFVATEKNKKYAVTPEANVYAPVCFNKYDRLWFPYKSKKIFNGVVNAADIDSYDMIHAHTIFTDGNVALNIKKNYGKPFIAAVRHTDLFAFFKYMPHLRKIGIQVMKEASRIIFLCDAYKEFTIETYVPEHLRAEIRAKSMVVANGISPVFLDNTPDYRHRKAGKSVRMITVAYINQNKNQATVCEAAEVLHKRGYDVSYVVIGQPRDKKLYKIVNASPYVTHHPFMAHEELVENYRQADIYVMPSYGETFGLTYVEAMSQGLPVIYTKGQGFDGHFAEGEVGYHVDPASPEEIADAVERILSRYDDISRNSIDGSKRFDWNIIAEEYIKLYQAVESGNQAGEQCEVK